MLNTFVLIAAVVVGIWNGNWFPSGRAKHRAHPDVEAATVKAAAKMLADGLAEMDPAGTNDVILCLNEIRGPRVASNLVAQIGRPGLRVAVVSGYRWSDRYDEQQDVIATTLPVAEAHWSLWKANKKLRPPRGYAFAAVVVDPATTANVYAVHLKSNYRANTAEKRTLNETLRWMAVAQVAEQERKRRRRPQRPVILAGDMNADKWGRQFASERLFGVLEEAGFVNTLALLPPERRGTHPSKTYGDSALDYVFCRGFGRAEPPHVIPNDGLSDHQAVFVLLHEFPISCPWERSR